MTSAEAARKAILDRWTEVLQLIEARDEGGILPLINRQDEFCERADAGWRAIAPEAEAHDYCQFCPGFQHSGGCLGRLAALNHAVLIGDWREAGRVAQQYVDWIRSLPLDEPLPELPRPAKPL